MKKNNLNIILLLLIVFGCSEKRRPATLLSKMQSEQRESFLRRKLASVDNAKCVKDLFTISNLKLEAEELEKIYEHGQKVSGKWRHIDLEDLPIPQANFLKAYGNEIGDLANPNSIDYSSCNDLPCIFNKIYGKESGINGWVHYIWYLKFGNMLSADNKIPSDPLKGETPSPIGSYNSKKIPFEKFLYSDKELYGFWRLSQMLRPSHGVIPLLKEIQRLPVGENFELESEKGACGLASSTGWIKLQDGCLIIYDRDNDDGYFYKAVTHEMSHAIDYYQGRTIYHSSFRSQQKDYLDIAGFSIVEYIDEATKKRISRWSIKEGAMLVSRYAETCPAESFAEDLVMFRIAGSVTKKNIKGEHFNFISENYYRNRAFDLESLNSTWISQYSGDLTKGAFKAVVDCTNNSGQVKSNYYRNSDFNFAMVPSMIGCLGASAEDLSKNLKAKVSLKEPEACRFLSRTDSPWEKTFKQAIVPIVSKYIQETQKDSAYLANIQKFYDHLTDKKMAMDAYVNCYGEDSEEDCYEKEVYQLAYNKAQELKLPDSHSQELANLYVGYHGFSDVRNESDSSYFALMMTNQDMIKAEVKDLWDACGNINQNNDSQPTGDNIDIGPGYLISSYYNCLNNQFADTVKKIVDKIQFEGSKAENPKEIIILSKEVHLQVRKFIEQIYLDASIEESEKAKNFLAKDNGVLRLQLLSNLSWMTNLVDPKKIQNDCFKVGLDRIDSLPYFHLKKDLYGEYVEKNVCAGIEGTPEYSKLLENSKGDFLNNAYTNLENKIYTAGVDKAKSCVAKYPIDTALNRVKFKKERDACLLDFWVMMEPQMLKSFEHDPSVKKFNIDMDDLKLKIEANRRRLQLKIMKEFF